MSKQSLLDISDDFAVLDDLIQENEGDLDKPEVVEALAAIENDLNNNLRDKVDNYAAYITTLKARSTVRDAEAKRLAGRAKTDTFTAKNLSGRLVYAFDRLSVKKVETQRYRVGVVNNGGVVPLVIEDESKLPEPFIVTEVVRRPNTEAIRQALANGLPVPGCALGERGRHLSIR